MRRLQPVIWMKGTFLNPQYLQSQDLYLENTLQFHLGSLSYAPWGFQQLRVDHEALAAGYFSLAQASGIFSDGLLFDIPNSDPGPAPKPLAEFLEPDQETMDIYLAVPHYRDRGLNVSLPDGDADTRYLTDVAMLRDENTGKTEKP
ncbi:MAG: type VI secretion system baseplate subunit TssK, partial [Acidobacteriota bacterium]